LGEAPEPVEVVVRAVISLYSDEERPVLQFALPSKFSRSETTLRGRAVILLAEYPDRQLRRLLELARRYALTQNSHREQ
jgi:hypothetical protein